MLCCCPACSIAEVLYNVDTAIQYGEDAEVKARDDAADLGAIEEGEEESAID
jgi:hypothetical protein